MNVNISHIESLMRRAGWRRAQIAATRSEIEKCDAMKLTCEYLNWHTDKWIYFPPARVDNSYRVSHRLHHRRGRGSRQIRFTPKRFRLLVLHQPLKPPPRTACAVFHVSELIWAAVARRMLWIMNEWISITELAATRRGVGAVRRAKNWNMQSCGIIMYTKCLRKPTL